MKQPSNIIQFGTNEDVVFATKQSTFSEFQMRQDLDIFEQLHWLLPTTIVNKIKSQSEYIEPYDAPTTKTIAGWNMHIIAQEKAIMQVRQNPQSSTATNDIVETETHQVTNNTQFMTMKTASTDAPNLNKDPGLIAEDLIDKTAIEFKLNEKQRMAFNIISHAFLEQHVFECNLDNAPL